MRNCRTCQIFSTGSWEGAGAGGCSGGGSASQQGQGWIDRKETPYKKYKGLRIN